MRKCVLMFLLLLAGCGTPKVWYRENTSAQQFQMDKAEGQLRYHELVLGTPQVNIAVAQSQSANGGYADSSASAGKGGGVAGAIANAIDRGRFVDEWLMAKGYRRVPIAETPTNWPTLTNQR